MSYRVHTFPAPPVPFSLPLDHQRAQWQLEVIGWSRQELGRRLDVSPTKVANWMTGRSFMPNRVSIWLEQLALTMMALPGPLLWERHPAISAEQHALNVERFEQSYEQPRALADMDED